MCLATQKEQFMKTLKQELMEKLPPEEIGVDIGKGFATYYDYHGVTFCENTTERQIVERYIVDVIATKAGFPIKVTEWGENNNGHFAHRFERA